ncbi:hypothetical protein [Pseudomonas abieticivorans]|uniref:hypothetical protein n=1 Tax=Pseudomonas abieticivorans TaxID=2931382 RepID=UPI0020BF56CE|nr:hypothetical protein [Pseudomonas sp. PIA16]
MIRTVNLSVTFPNFGTNYFAQHVEARRSVALIEDKSFDAYLMPQAIHHFSNGVVGFNDQCRFLSNILGAHLSA